MDYNIFPVEFYSILQELKDKKFKPEITEPKKEQDSSCIFLKDHKCTIYASRPVICRTHGLPLLYANNEGEWELSACELNFTAFNFEKFTGKNTFPQDKFNSKLFLVNKQFISEISGINYNEFDLIPLKNLAKELLKTEQ
jgi:Fe-S-cluster containining protein